MKKVLALVVLACSLALGEMSYAATATWNANTEKDLAGYNLYEAPGTCANPGAFAKVNTYAATATSGSVANPTANGNYCFKLTAFNVGGLESLFSNSVEVTFSVVPPAAPTGLVVTNP